MPPPPQADEKIAAVVAIARVIARNRAAEFPEVMKIEIRDITNDTQDMSFVIGLRSPLAGSLAAHASEKMESAYKLLSGAETMPIHTPGSQRRNEAQLSGSAGACKMQVDRAVATGHQE